MKFNGGGHTTAEDQGVGTVFTPNLIQDNVKTATKQWSELASYDASSAPMCCF